MKPYRWAILAVGVGAQMAISAVRQGLPSVGPALQSQFDLSLSQLGVLFGAVSLGIVLTLIPWGALADRRGERMVIGVGLTGAAVATTAAALAPSYPALVVALVVTGMFGASATGASGRAVMGWFARSQRGLALGIRQTGVPLGGGVAAIALPLIVAAFSLRAALLTLAAGCLVAAAGGWRWMREAPPPPPNRPVVNAPPPTRDRRLWRLATGSGLLVVAQSSLLGFLVIFLVNERGWSLGAAAAVLAAVQVGGSAVRIGAGRWSDRREERVAPMRWMTLAGSVFLVATAALTAGPDWLLAGAIGTAGILAMGWNGLSFTAAAELSGRERAGTAISVQNTVLSAGAALAPMLFGLLVDATSWTLAWAALTAFQLAGVAVLGASMTEERRRRAARDARLAAQAGAGSWQSSKSISTPVRQETT